MQKVPELRISVDPRKRDEFVSVCWRLGGVSNFSEGLSMGRMSVGFRYLDHLFDGDVAEDVWTELAAEPEREPSGELSISGSFLVQIGRAGSISIAIRVESQDPVRAAVKTRWVSVPIHLHTALSGGIGKPSLSLSDWAGYRPLLAPKSQSRGVHAETSKRAISEIVDTSPALAGLFASSLDRRERHPAIVSNLSELGWISCPLQSIRQCANAGDFRSVFVHWHKLFRADRDEKLRYVVKTSRDSSGFVPVDVATSGGRVWVELELTERGGYVYWLSGYLGRELNASLIFPLKQEQNCHVIPAGRHVVPGAAWMPDTVSTQMRGSLIQFGVSESDECSLVLVCPAPLSLEQLYASGRKVNFSGPIRLKDEETKELLIQALSMPGARMAFATVRVKSGRVLGQESRNSLHKNVAQELADRYRTTAPKQLMSQRSPLAATKAPLTKLDEKLVEGKVDLGYTAKGAKPQQSPNPTKRGTESKAHSLTQHGIPPSVGRAKQESKRAESSSEFVQDQSPQSIFDRLVNFGKSRRK